MQKLAEICIKRPVFATMLILFLVVMGLDAYRKLAPQLPRLLNEGGLAAVEIGHDQAEAVTALLARDGLSARVDNDLAGRPRAVLLTWAA